MIDKIKQFQENLKKNQKFSDIKLHLRDCFKNFCFDSFIQHIFSKIIIIIQIYLVVHYYKTKYEDKNNSILFNNVTIFGISFLTWKIFYFILDYLHDISLLKFLKLMKTKDYFSIGIFYRKIILISLAYLIIFYFPFVYFFQQSFNNLLLRKSIDIDKFLSNFNNNTVIKNNNASKDLINFNSNLNNDPDNIKLNKIKYSKSHENSNVEDIDIFKRNRDNEIKINEESLLFSQRNLRDFYHENFANNNDILNDKINNIYIENEIKELNKFQYLYFSVLLIKIFNQLIQNIFFTFGYNKYLNKMYFIKFIQNIFTCFSFLRWNFHYLFCIFISDFISEIISIVFFIIVITIHDPFPQVWISPSLGIFNIDKNLICQILNLKKILKYFILNFWYDLLILLYFIIKLNSITKENIINLSINQNSNIEEIKKDLEINYISYLNSKKAVEIFRSSINNFILLKILIEFFFYINLYTKRKYYIYIIENIQMISIIKENKIQLNNVISLTKNEDFFQVTNKTFKNNYKKPLLAESNNIKFKTQKFPGTVSNQEQNLNIDEKIDIKIYPNSTFVKNIHQDETNNDNILVVIKKKLYESFLLICIIFLNITILKLLKVFNLLNPFNKQEYFKIDFFYLIIMFFCGSVNFFSNQFFIINDFLDNPIDEIRIIYGFCIFSLLPFLIIINFVSNYLFLFVISTLINIYFIYIFWDYLNTIDLRFKKIDQMINKELFDI